MWRYAEARANVLFNLGWWDSPTPSSLLCPLMGLSPSPYKRIRTWDGIRLAGRVGREGEGGVYNPDFWDCPTQYLGFLESVPNVNKASGSDPPGFQWYILTPCVKYISHNITCIHFSRRKLRFSPYWPTAQCCNIYIYIYYNTVL